MHVHHTWVVINMATRHVVHYANNGSFAAFITESDAIKEAARLMKEHPDLDFAIRQTKIQLPWLL